MTDYVVGAKKEDRERVKMQDSRDIDMNDGKTWLRKTKVSAFFPKDRVEILKAKASSPLGEVFETLISHKILSMPVFDDNQGRYTSFIDMLDMVNYIVEKLQEVEITGENFHELLRTGTKFTKTTCGSVAGASGRNPFYPIDENAPLSAAIQLMTDNKVHRLPIISNDLNGDLVTIVTQSLAAQIILENIEKFSFVDRTVKELKMGDGDDGMKQVITLEKNVKVIEAFKLIYNQKISGVGVVDNGKLIGNISASDIKHMGANASHISRLFLPTEEYLALMSQHAKDSSLRAPLCVSPLQTFREVLSLMVENKVHRIYITNEKMEPVGVISLGDLLSTIIHHA
jgi:CBS domain-containing protein